MDATCGVITTFGKSWNGRWNGRPCFASGYVHQVSRAARNLGWDFKWSNRSSSTMSLPRAMFTRIASSFICAKKRRLTIPRVSRVKGRARTTASACGNSFGRPSTVTMASAGSRRRRRDRVTTTSAVAHASSRSSAGRSPRITGSNAPEAIRPTTLRRSASIGAVKRTRGIGVPDAAAGLGPFDATRSAFRVAARVALDAPFLEHEGLATLWALRVQALPEQLGGVAGLLLHLDVRLDRSTELVVRLDGRLNAGLLHPDVEDLVPARAVAVDRDPFAM